MPNCVHSIKRREISQKDQTSSTVCETVGTSGPPFHFPLTSVFLSTYLLTSPLDATTNQHFMCPAQWNELPEATWQGTNSQDHLLPSPRMIRRGCPRVPTSRVILPNPVSHFTCLPVIAGCRSWETCIPPLMLGESNVIPCNIWGGESREWDRTEGQGSSTFLDNKQW